MKNGCGLPGGSLQFQTSVFQVVVVVVIGVVGVYIVAIVVVVVVVAMAVVPILFLLNIYVELDLKSCICSLTCICIALGFASVCKHSRPQLRNAQDLFVFNSNYDRLQIPNHDRAHITFQSSAALSI